MTSIMESSPIRNRSASPCGTLGESNSQKRARTIADTSSSLDRFSPAVRVATRRTHLRTSRSPRSREGMSNGMHFVLNRERRRIQIAKQPVTDRCLLFYDRLQFTHVNFRLRDSPQQ